jgi:hypothetical protein
VAGLGGGLAFGFGVELGAEQDGQAGQVEPQDEHDHAGERKEFTWFGLGASLPLLSIGAERAARQVVGMVRERRAEIILTPAGQVVSRIAGLAPGLTSTVLHLVQRLALPGASTAPDGEGTPDQDLEPAFARKAFDRLTSLGRAASRFNEYR